MALSSKIQRLSQALTEDQREQMRKNIDVYLCLSEDMSRNIIQRGSNDRQRTLNAEAEMTNAALGTKMGIWMRGLVSTKSSATAYVNVKMDALRSTIQAASPDLVDLSSCALNPAFAEAVFDMYENIRPLVPAFHSVFSDKNRLEELVMTLLCSRIPALKTNLTDFMDIEEIKQIYIDSENKGELVNRIVARIDRYLGELNEELFVQLAEGASVMYYFRNLISFGFPDFFRVFGHIPDADQSDEAPVFHSSSGVENVELLESLYYCIYPFIKAFEGGKTNFTLYPEVLDYLARATLHSEPEELDQDARQSAVELKQRLMDLFAAVENFSRSVPLAAMIKYLRNDPYYKMLIYFPKLKLRKFYETAVRLQVLVEVDKSFQGIRLGIIETLTKRLFKDQKVKDFEFYRGSAPSMVTKLGLPTFTYVRSLGLMYNFIIQQYYGYMQELIHNLNRIAAVRSREDLTRMLLHAAGLEDLADTIRKFDQTFSPETAEGKTFYRMRYALEKEISQQKNYRGFITEKDLECRSMIAKGLELGNGLVSVFKAILADKNNVLRERLLNTKSAQVVSRRYDDVLKQSIEAIELAFKIIRQLMSIEEGA